MTAPPLLAPPPQVQRFTLVTYLFQDGCQTVINGKAIIWASPIGLISPSIKSVLGSAFEQRLTLRHAFHIAWRGV